MKHKVPSVHAGRAVLQNSRSESRGAWKIAAPHTSDLKILLENISGPTVNATLSVCIFEEANNVCIFALASLNRECHYLEGYAVVFLRDLCQRQRFYDTKIYRIIQLLGIFIFYKGSTRVVWRFIHHDRYSTLSSLYEKIKNCFL